MTHRRPQLARLGAAALLALAAAACQGATGARVAAPGIPIAVESIEGAPDAVKTALASELAAAASERQVELVGAGDAARYRVRGYLSANASPEGAPQLAFVWDVFDAQKRHARRVTGVSSIKSAAGDPWSTLDGLALRRLASQSMDEIAGFLVASGASDEETAVAQAPAGPALSYAEE